MWNNLKIPSLSSSKNLPCGMEVAFNYYIEACNSYYQANAMNPIAQSVSNNKLKSTNYHHNHQNEPSKLMLKEKKTKSVHSLTGRVVD